MESSPSGFYVTAVAQKFLDHRKVSPSYFSAPGGKTVSRFAVKIDAGATRMIGIDTIRRGSIARVRSRTLG